ncbi:uncharacterized protein [Atheta coriaria]|uniref:uncharacterized protein n=1 Tax=Dalotia coriaria TaxID=877792 RepID=UPI0031F42B02
MFMFPEPNPKDFRLRCISFNSTSSELFTPDAFPRCTQTNLGLYSYPLTNTTNEYVVKKVKDTILDKWTHNAKAWWIGKPGENAQLMFDMHLKTKDNREIDPRFIAKTSILPRSYQYEQDCMESRRQQRLLQKIKQDEAEQLHGELVDTCICPESSTLVSDTNPQNIQEDGFPRWQKPPELFAESQHDPCKRRAEFQKVGQTYRTEACRFIMTTTRPHHLLNLFKSL